MPDTLAPTPVVPAPLSIFELLQPGTSGGAYDPTNADLIKTLPPYSYSGSGDYNSNNAFIATDAQQAQIDQIMADLERSGANNASTLQAAKAAVPAGLPPWLMAGFMASQVIDLVAPQPVPNTQPDSNDFDVQDGAALHDVEVGGYRYSSLGGPGAGPTPDTYGSVAGADYELPSDYSSAGGDYGSSSGSSYGSSSGSSYGPSPFSSGPGSYYSGAGGDF